MAEEQTTVDPDAEQPVEASKPEEAAAGPHRYKGPGRHMHAGRALKDGEVVNLTAAQARAFGDRFERVERDSPRRAGRRTEA